MGSYTINLPWPPKVLHPNARTHWAPKARATAKARNDARLACLSSGARGLGWDAAHVVLTFSPPDRRHRDIDGMQSAMKGSLDGISDAIGIDDSKWSFGAPVKTDPVAGGNVCVTISRPSSKEDVA